MTPGESAPVVRWDGDEPVVADAPRRIVIETDRCKGCGLCVAVCPPAVLALGGLNAGGYQAVILTDHERCTSCTACALICPDAVITVFRPARARGKAAA